MYKFILGDVSLPADDANEANLFVIFIPSWLRV